MRSMDEGVGGAAAAQPGSMDAVVVPNRRNAATELMLPVKMMEGIALGLPVFAPRLKAIEHYFSGDQIFYFDPDDAVKFWDMVNKQDWHVCELSQKGISSRAYEPGPYSARESIPAAWDREYLRHLR